MLAGRGWGKTRTGAEWVCSRVSDGSRHVALVGPTAADTRDVMVDGPSGILACSSGLKGRDRPRYESSRRRVLWPGSGSVALLFSAEEPDRLRGPQHDTAWCDEIAAWRYPETWDQLQFGLRLGAEPRCLVTTTPRPTRVVLDLVRAAGTVTTRGSTDENARNLAPGFLEALRRRYEGTRLERQERFAEILTDTPGALWTLAAIDALRVREAPHLSRIVVAVDPAVTAGAGSDETGIVVAGLSSDGHAYVLADHSLRGSPGEWSARAVRAYREHSADRIVAEANQGGDLVAATLRAADSSVPVRLVHASRGKRARAEPIAALYEQGRVHHVGSLATLEDQMTTWDASTAAGSPDRLDALVWALSELFPTMTAPVAQAPRTVRSNPRPAW